MANDLPTPESRKESYLAKAAGMDVEIPEEPRSRLEQYLNAIAEGGGGGGTTYTAGDGIDITNDTISVDTDTIQEKLTAGDGISIADEIIKATNTGKARVLTTADYDYPDANPTGIALWRLPAGSYSLLAGVQGYTSIYFNTPQTAITGLWLLADSYYGADAVKSMYVFNGIDELQYYLTNISDGTRRLGQTYVVQTQNNLTTTNVGYVLDARQGKVLKDLIDSLVIKNAGAPTTATVGTVGMLYEDTTNGKLYQCTAIDTTDPQNPSYTWSEIGGGVTPVQTTGTSTTDVMSQNAVTSMIYQDPSTKTRVQIGKDASTTGDNGVSIGNSCIANGSNVAIGYSSFARYSYGDVAIGYGSQTGNHKYSVALGSGAFTRNQGEINIGTYNFGGTMTNQGYNNTGYRIITDLHDGQDLHHAATVAQGNTLATSAPTTATVGVLGQLYTDTTNMHTYQCTAIDTTDPDNPSYTWTMRW